MSENEHTPTTEDVREAYWQVVYNKDWEAERVCQFDRWLAAHVAAIRAEAASDAERLARVRALLPGPRTWVEQLSRDIAGKPFPRMIDADALAAALRYEQEGGE